MLHYCSCLLSAIPFDRRLHCPPLFGLQPAIMKDKTYQLGNLSQNATNMHVNVFQTTHENVILRIDSAHSCTALSIIGMGQTRNFFLLKTQNHKSLTITPEACHFSMTTEIRAETASQPSPQNS